MKNKIFSSNQCGSQINRCTDDISSIFITDVYKAFNNKTDIDCAFTDFCKAYDSIGHDDLIYKLRHKNKINGNFLKCIIHFIKTRYTRVITKKGCSTWKLQTQRLPQGSSLSPILHILFTNDFKLKYTKVVRKGCFADDTAIWTLPSSIGTIKYKFIQKELSSFTDWTKY